MNRLQSATSVWIQGGLGNQLFQLSAGFHAQSFSGLPFIVSRSSYWRDSVRGFGIMPLLRRRQLATHIEDLVLGPPHHRTGELRTSTKRLNITIAESVEAASAHPSLMVGFFQDQQSVRLGTGRVTSLLRQIPVEPHNERIRELVSGRPVVHVRRGDYIALESARKTFGTIGREYYLDGLEMLGHKPDDAVFFSDDPQFVEKEFGVARASIVGPTAVKSDLQTMILMSMGSDILIPNSTFSWWAADLMGDRGRVVAPNVWFHDRDETLWPTRQEWLRSPNK